QQLLRQAVVEGTQPIGLRHRTPLRVRDRYHGNGREGGEDRLVFGQIEPAVQGGQKRSRLPREQRERVIVEMEVQEIEFLVVAFLPDPFQHHYVQRVGIADGSVEAQRLRP